MRSWGQYKVMTCPELEGWANPQLFSNEITMNWGIVDLSGVGNGAFEAPQVAHPRTQYDIAAAVRAAEKAGKTARAWGSLYSFSDAAFPQTSATLPEDQNPDSYGFGINTSALNSSLQHLLPSVLRTEFQPELFFFVEAGITINDFNSLLDWQKTSLALKTMGGSSGQTLAGATSTGTHGSDFDRSPLADSIRALYLIGAGGVHHWIEPSNPITDPTKLQTVFPCLLAENIHYDDIMFHAALVSMGGMGVIYAVILEVVPQYHLAQVTRYGTWEALQGAEPQGAGPVLSGAFSGDWTGIVGYLRGGQWHPKSPFNNRALQVVVNPIKNDDGTHKCYVTNRAEVPWQPGPTGQASADLSQLDASSLFSVIYNDPDCDLGAHTALGAEALSLLMEARPAGNAGLVYQLRQLIGCCETYGYAFAVRALVNFVLESALPEYDPHDLNKYPRVDLGYRIMANGVFAGGFPLLSIVSTEVFFELHAGIDFVSRLLRWIDSEVDQKRYPAGYVSLRVCGATSAPLGLQKSSRTACIEVSLVNSDEAPAVIEQVERMAMETSGFLHWGQSNGLMDGSFVDKVFGTASVAQWKAVQSQLGGKTFTNMFMKRCGLESPDRRLVESSIKLAGGIK